MNIVMRRFSYRGCLVFAIAVAAAGIVAGSIAAKLTPLRITAPSRAFQGKVSLVSVKSSSVGCKLTVRYANGDKQADMLPATVAKSKVTWRWLVPDFAPAGQAKLTAACPRAATATKSVLVVGGLIPPRIDVVKKGFSARVQNGNENVSYGLVLQNTSPNGNALNVDVLVNFVLADNHLIGSASSQIPIINAGSTYNLGGNLGFIGAPSIVRLEVVVNPGGRARSAKSVAPGLENVHLVPTPYDPAWLGSVEGDLINVQPSLMLTNANLSCVVFDANGNVLGGGQGTSSFKLFPGTRAFFKLDGGLNPIPFNEAASASVSILPQYESASP